MNSYKSKQQGNNEHHLKTKKTFAESIELLERKDILNKKFKKKKGKGKQKQIDGLEVIDDGNDSGELIDFSLLHKNDEGKGNERSIHSTLKRLLKYRHESKNEGKIVGSIRAIRASNSTKSDRKSDWHNTNNYVEPTPKGEKAQGQKT